ncbi:hypothetical protein RND71_032951 [Anisodus tanguticus]|uniref:SPX domain-containing protein n=1 Tax=Anisodus tanguticus TaxID=243964 RepID=A0AAE1UX26_9SOLA|nr:hypothetical protein RND71_032951 [Anisodus tanguticus]
MKFGKEIASQMVHEWQEAYMDYNYLKGVLKDILNFKQKNAPLPDVAATPKGSLKRRLSMYKAFSGLQSRYNSFKGSPGKNNHEDEMIVVQQEDSEGHYGTIFLVSCEEGGESELLFFRRLDDEFNKVLNFYQKKVGEVKVESDELSKQMDALIALTIKVDKISIGMQSAQVMDYVTVRSFWSQMEAIQEVEMTSEEILEEAIQEVETTSEEILEEESTTGKRDKAKMNLVRFRPAPLEILDNVKIKIEPETRMSTLRSCIMTSKSHLSFSKEELRKAEEQMKKAFVEFYQKLRLLKSYRECSLNVCAFSKMMKKYDKITSRKAVKSYLEMIEKSYLGSSVEVLELFARVEATFIKHFVNGNRRKGMKYLRPQGERETHRVTFVLGLFSGCSIALVAAIAVSIHAGNLLEHEGRGQYMENIFPLYSLFGFVGTELGYRQVLLLASGLSVLALTAALSHLDMDMDPKTRKFETVTELIPLALVIVLLLILFCPLNIIYRSSRFFFLRTAWHCLCAPLYKINLPARKNYNEVLHFRFRQLGVCNSMSATMFGATSEQDQINVKKAVFTPSCTYSSQLFPFGPEERNLLESNGGINFRNYYSCKTYWDIVMDWGLLQRNSKNTLGDKLLVPYKIVYFVAIASADTDFQELPFLHKKAFVAIVACLEILLRGMWNFFRLENEHLNNVGKYRASKSVPLPFNYDEDESMCKRKIKGIPSTRDNFLFPWFLFSCTVLLIH